MCNGKKWKQDAHSPADDIVAIASNIFSMEGVQRKGMDATNDTICIKFNNIFLFGKEKHEKENTKKIYQHSRIQRTRTH